MGRSISQAIDHWRQAAPVIRVNWRRVVFAGLPAVTVTMPVTLFVALGLQGTSACSRQAVPGGNRTLNRPNNAAVVAPATRRTACRSGDGYALKSRVHPRFNKLSLYPDARDGG